jgi:hypothetical protein
MTTALLTWAFAAPLLAQAPLPFPGAAAPPAEPARTQKPTPPPQPVAPAPVAQAPTATTTPAGSNGSPARVGGFPVYPTSQLLGSYDAGKGQRYYLYGTTRPYADVVTFYQSELKDKGDQVFTNPLTHMFAQKFKEETMAFPPGVTVKDWTQGSQGYPNPTGATPARFPTVIMIVPPPPDAAAAPAR